MNHPFPITSRKPPRQWKRIIAKCTSSLPDYFWTLCSTLALGLIAAFAIIPAITRRRAQESIMREVQLIMDEK